LGLGLPAFFLQDVANDQAGSFAGEQPGFWKRLTDSFRGSRG